MVKRTINEQGRAEILNFLSTYSREARIFGNVNLESEIAFCNEQLTIGPTATVRLGAHNCVDNVELVYTVRESGITTHHADIVPSDTINLDLTQIDGNAFALIGAFRRQAKREDWPQEKINSISIEAMSKDYDHLLQTLTKYCR